MRLSKKDLKAPSARYPIESKATVSFWRDNITGKTSRTVPYPVEFVIPGAEIGQESPRDDIRLLLTADSAKRLGNALTTLGAKAKAAQRVKDCL